MKVETPTLTAFLEEVAGHLSPDVRDDVLLEIESHVLDRADEEAGGEANRSAIDAVVHSLGAPFDVAASFHPAGQRHLVGPEQYRPFVVYTSIVYVVHLLLIGIGTLVGASSRLAPVTIRDGDGVMDVGGIVVIAIHALLFDLGLMLVIFVASSRLGRHVNVPTVAFPVRRSRRASIARALLGTIVLVALGFLSDRIFVLHGEGESVSLLSGAFARWRPWLLAFLIVLIAKEVFHVARGEQRLTVTLDAIVGAIGTALFVALIVADPLLAVPRSAGTVGAETPLGFLVARLLQLLWIVFAAVFAVATLQRLFRLRTLRR